MFFTPLLGVGHHSRRERKCKSSKAAPRSVGPMAVTPRKFQPPVSQTDLYEKALWLLSLTGVKGLFHGYKELLVRVPFQTRGLKLNWFSVWHIHLSGPTLDPHCAQHIPCPLWLLGSTEDCFFLWGTFFSLHPDLK